MDRIKINRNITCKEKGNLKLVSRKDWGKSSLKRSRKYIGSEEREEKPKQKLKGQKCVWKSWGEPKQYGARTDPKNVGKSSV